MPCIPILLFCYLRELVSQNSLRFILAVRMPHEWLNSAKRAASWRFTEVQVGKSSPRSALEDSAQVSMVLPEGQPESSQERSARVRSLDIWGTALRAWLPIVLSLRDNNHPSWKIRIILALMGFSLGNLAMVNPYYN
jgi:hypothetical protein